MQETLWIWSESNKKNQTLPFNFGLINKIRGNNKQIQFQFSMQANEMCVKKLENLISYFIKIINTTFFFLICHFLYLYEKI